MLREILLVALEQGRHIGGYEVDLSANFFSLTGRQSAETEVRVQAARHALEQFLVRLPDRREDHLLVGAEGANQSVARHQRAERARVHVGARHVRGAPRLPRHVSGLGGPIACGHPCELAIEEDEAAREVVGCVAGALFLKSHEPAQTHARLRPVCFTARCSRIVGNEAKVHVVVARSNRVFNSHAVGQRVFQPERFRVGAERNELVLVRDHRVLHPVGVRRAGAAVGFQVVDANRAGQMPTADDEPVVGAGEREGRRQFLEL